MTLTGNKVITLRKLTSKVTAEKGIPLKQFETYYTYHAFALLDLIYKKVLLECQSPVKIWHGIVIIRNITQILKPNSYENAHLVSRKRKSMILWGMWPK